jgi:hypothetical protein
LRLADAAHDGLLDEAGFLRARSYRGERDASGMIIVRAKLPWIRSSAGATESGLENRGHENAGAGWFAMSSIASRVTVSLMKKSL